ncbi:hypothetical protein L1049_011200 [Liquidambar formosana]|uniref:DUF674 domain-containing protein n=1 Tax=Liquidambar formosana TaxID=63359 RepID=A0AAP0RRC0_LIQFO
MPTTKVSLRLMIDKNAHKVLFAEAEKEFVDFLFHLLSLPVGTVVRLLSKQNMVGCIGSLYESIENLSETYMQHSQNKDILLKPSAPPQFADFPFLLADESVSAPANRFFNCPNNHRYVSDDPRNTCPLCWGSMSRDVTYVAPVTTNRENKASTSEGGYVKGLFTYMVMDDLSVMPVSVIAGIGVLNKCNVKEFDALEEKKVEFGIDEGLQLLKASLQSKAALTYVFLGEKGPIQGCHCT